jgi:adenylate cyclase
LAHAESSEVTEARATMESRSLDTAELAAATGTTPERVADLVAREVLTPVGPDRFDLADIHRMRVIEAFERVGVPLDALVAATRAGRVSFEYYGDLHPTPSRPSSRTYADFAGSLGSLGERLPDLYAAFGLAEPATATHLGVDDERFLAEILDTLEGTGRFDMAIRAVRVFAEGGRRASIAALGIYDEFVVELGESFFGLPPADSYRILEPWGRFARTAPSLGGWLAGQHMSRAIDAYSAETTERILEDLGYVPERGAVLPGVAFVDLTGFTQLSEERGDEAAAGVALQLADLARDSAAHQGGSVVKLLGDGVLLRFPDALTAVRGSLDLLAALPGAGLPAGHAGVHRGRVIDREGDIYGRTVNLASRVADVAPAGVLLVTADVVGAITDVDLTIEPAGQADLKGIGSVPLFRISR